MTVTMTAIRDLVKVNCMFVRWEGVSTVDELRLLESTSSPLYICAIRNRSLHRHQRDMKSEVDCLWSTINRLGKYFTRCLRQGRRSSAPPTLEGQGLQMTFTHCSTRVPIWRRWCPHLVRKCNMSCYCPTQSLVISKLQCDYQDVFNINMITCGVAARGVIVEQW